MMPAPIQPASTPQDHRLPQSAFAQVRAASTWLLDAKLTPVHGLTYPSARACIGAHTHATAAVSTRVFIARRIVPAPSARLIAPRERRCKRYALDRELRRVDRAAERVRVRIVGSSAGCRSAERASTVFRDVNRGRAGLQQRPRAADVLIARVDMTDRHP